MLPEPVLPEQVESLAPDERKAVAVAKVAVRQQERLAGYPGTDDAHLAFCIERTDAGWGVQVWPFNRDERDGEPIFTAGNFVYVSIDNDWNVTRITGGA